jgi:hypothetical protein
MLTVAVADQGREVKRHPGVASQRCRYAKSPRKSDLRVRE